MGSRVYPRQSREPRPIPLLAMTTGTRFLDDVRDPPSTHPLVTGGSLHGFFSTRRTDWEVEVLLGRKRPVVMDTMSTPDEVVVSGIIGRLP